MPDGCKDKKVFPPPLSPKKYMLYIYFTMYMHVL
jgi:hypothetical protein